MEHEDHIKSDDDIVSEGAISITQEKALLEEHSNDGMAPKPSTFVLTPAKLLSHGKTSRGELTIALKPSALSSGQLVTPAGTANDESARSRSRSRNRRNAVKQKSLARQTGTGNEGLSTPGKRGREAGETPPSASQPGKKNRNRRNKRKTPLPSGSSVDNVSQQNVCATATVAAPVPPASATLQSSGTGDAANDSSIPIVAQSGVSSNLVNADANLHEPSASMTQKVQQSEQPVSGAVQNVEENPQGRSSYAEVASNLCAAIIDQRGSGSMTLLDQKRFDTLYTLITDKVLSQAGKNISPPNFDDTRLHSGAMRVRCADFHSRQWLEKFVPTLDKKKLWKDASPVVINFSDIPKPHKFNVFVRGLRKSAQDVFKLLESQNKGVTTKSWTALSCEFKNGGTSMTIGVGQDSFETLRQRSNQLFCGMGKATFTLVKGCKENQNALQQKAVPVRKASGGNATAPRPPVSKNSGTGDSVDHMETDEAGEPPDQN